MEATEKIPRAIGAERSLLGAALRYPDRGNELLGLVEPRDYFDEFHQKTWEYLRDQHRNGGVDIARARRDLQPPESSKGDFTRDYFDDLIDEVTTSVHAPADAAKIIERRQLRDRVDHHYTMVQHALNGYTPERIDLENEAALFDWKLLRAFRNGGAGS